MTASVAGLEKTEGEVTAKVDTALASLAKALEEGASSVGVTLSTFSLLYENEVGKSNPAVMVTGLPMNDPNGYFDGDGKDGTLRSKYQRDWATISTNSFPGDFKLQYHTGESLYPICGMITKNNGWTQNNNPLTTFCNMRAAAVQHDRNNLHVYTDSCNRETRLRNMPWKPKLITWERVGAKTMIKVESDGWVFDASQWLGTKELWFAVGHHNGTVHARARTRTPTETETDTDTDMQTQ